MPEDGGEAREQRLDAIIAEYLEAVDSGQAPDEEAWIARYPDLAEDLREFLADDELARRAMSPARSLAEELASAHPSGTEQDLVGRVLHDTHRITRLIGRGGMGTVYEAEHVRLAGARFAIKVLHRGMADRPDAFGRFKREAEIATALRHPNIVDVLDFYGTEDGLSCMVMEYLEGESLASRLQRRGTVDPGALAGLMAQVGAGLQVAHDEGIVHRDMKPANIYLVPRPDGGVLVKILDFGISKIRDSTEIITGDHTLIGTPHYMAPEQAEGTVKEIDHRTDIFALGTICYQALYGQYPFDAPTTSGIVYKICRQEPHPGPGASPALDGPLRSVLARAMAKRKEHRYQRVRTFVEEFGDALADVDEQGTAASQAGPGSGPPASTTLRLEAPDTGGGGRIGYLALAAALVGLAAVLYVSLRDREPPRPAPERAAAPREAFAPPRPDTQPGTRVAGPADASVDAPTRVRVTLVLTPRSARVFLDGHRRRDNPLVLEPSRENHLLRVWAPGHVTKVQSLVAEEDMTIRVKLTRMEEEDP
jgi:tRNA A-37 threonylcarbamoyl transferase component Bud32